MSLFAQSGLVGLGEGQVSWGLGTGGAAVDQTTGRRLGLVERHERQAIVASPIRSAAIVRHVREARVAMRFIQGDTDTLIATLRVDNQVPPDLDTATVFALIKHMRTLATTELACELVSADTGKVKHEWGPGELEALDAETYAVVFVVDYGAGDQKSYPGGQISIAARI